MFAPARAALVAITVALAIGLAPSLAWAEEPRETYVPPAPAAPAKPAESALKARGDEALVNGRPAEALTAYQAAYAAKPDPALVYNIGRAYQALGDFPAALEQLEKFEATAPPDIRAKVPGLPTLLADVRKNVALLAVVADVEGATVRLDARILGTTPLRAPVRVKAGAGTVYVEKDGYFPYQHSVILAGGGIVTSDVKLASKQTKAIVTVRSVVAGARIAVDGKSEGTVPTDVVVTPGNHRLELTLDGYRPTRTDVALAAGERRSIDLGLEREAPITKKWWFWTGLGVIAVGATITIIALTTERSPDTGNVAPGRINTGLSF